jgi:DNA-binding Lrp family transcriptional regulator
MKNLTALDFKILFELIKNSRRSDRQLAKILNVSQPTITRRRTIIEKNGILEYTAIPDLKKLGFEILAFTFGKWNFQKYPDTRVEEIEDFIAKHPNIIFISTGTGSGYDIVGISIHKDYSDYSKIIQDFRLGWGKYFESFTTFVVSLQSDDILRNLTFKYLANILEDQTKSKT